MPETDGGNAPISLDVCLLRSQNILNNVSDLKGDVQANHSSIMKLSKILIGNGDIGLLEKVNTLYHRNQLIDQVFGVIKSILVTLITLYLTGVLHL